MEAQELQRVLGLHAKWLRMELGAVRANLSGADLVSANLSGANLRSADLRSADLRSADLNGADLRSADLRSADLNGADLNSADLSGADLSGADLNSANLLSAKFGAEVVRDAVPALRRARGLIEAVGHWTQGQMERTLTGDEHAYCSLGASRRADGTGYPLAMLYLQHAMGGSILAFNDREGRTHEQILAAFDRAIVQAEAMEAEMLEATS